MLCQGSKYWYAMNAPLSATAANIAYIWGINDMQLFLLQSSSHFLSLMDSFSVFYMLRFLFSVSHNKLLILILQTCMFFEIYWIFL